MLNPQHSPKMNEMETQDSPIKIGANIPLKLFVQLIIVNKIENWVLE